MPRSDRDRVPVQLRVTADEAEWIHRLARRGYIEHFAAGDGGSQGRLDDYAADPPFSQDELDALLEPLGDVSPGTDAEMSRDEQILYALRDVGLGTWVVTGDLVEQAPVDDEDFRHKTVSSGLHRLWKKGRIQRRERPGQVPGNHHHEYALNGERTPPEDGLTEGTLLYTYLRVVGRANDGVKAQSAMVMAADVAGIGASDAQASKALSKLTEYGYLDRRYSKPGKLPYEYWMNEQGDSELMEHDEDNDWTGGL